MGVVSEALQMYNDWQTSRDPQYYPTENAVPLGTPRAERLKIAQREAGQYNERQVAAEKESWLSKQSPDSLDLNPPILEGSNTGGKDLGLLMDAHVADSNNLTRFTQSVSDALTNKKISRQQYTQILKQLQPFADSVERTRQELFRDTTGEARTEARHLRGDRDI